MAENPSVPPAPPAPAKAAFKETLKPFQKGGVYFLGDLEHCQGFSKGELDYAPAVYVDGDGTEYEARISPLPVNKGDIVDVSALEDSEAAFGRLKTLDPVSQVRELKRLESVLSKPAKAMALNGEIVRLAEYKGRWCKTILITDEASKQTHRYPVVDLIVNFSKSALRPEWKPIALVRPKEFVPAAPPGMKQVPHFKEPRS